MTVTTATAARLLALAASFDNRTVSEITAQAWADALHDLEPDECAHAIRSHFRESDVYLMPVHIRQRVKARREILARAKPVADHNAIPDADPDDVPAYLAAVRTSRFRASHELPARPVQQLIEGTFK
jgi:hypothetical protein